MKHASVKTQYTPFQADCNTAFPELLCSTDVQVLVCKEAKPRPDRTNYVCSSNRSPEWIQTDTNIDIDIDVNIGMDFDINISNILT